MTESQGRSDSTPIKKRTIITYVKYFAGLWCVSWWVWNLRLLGINRQKPLPEVDGRNQSHRPVDSQLCDLLDRTQRW